METDDDMAYKLVELYIKEVAQKHEKTSMGLNTVINAYIWSLARIKKKKEELGIIENSGDMQKAETKLKEEVNDGDIEDILYDEKPRSTFGF